MQQPATEGGAGLEDDEVSAGVEEELALPRNGLEELAGVEDLECAGPAWRAGVELGPPHTSQSGPPPKELGPPRHDKDRRRTGSGQASAATSSPVCEWAMAAVGGHKLCVLGMVENESVVGFIGRRHVWDRIHPIYDDSQIEAVEDKVLSTGASFDRHSYGFIYKCYI
jgi:hypothetical protein